MTEQRKGKIAYELLILKLVNDGIDVGQHLKREIGNMSKTTKIPVEEIKQFLEELLPKVLTECLKERPRKQKKARVETKNVS